MAKKAYVYDGSAWQEITSDSAIPVATTSNTGIVQLVDSVNSTSTVNAAVPNSVKTAYDQAVTATTNAATAQSTADEKAAVGSTAPLETNATASAGSSAEASRADHVHVASTPSSATPLAIAATPLVGTSTIPSREDHVHEGVTSITGTANQVIASAADGPVTLSLPQSIATTSTPTFGATTINGIITSNQSGTLDVVEGILLQRTSSLTISSTSLSTSPTTGNTMAISWSSAVKANTSMWNSGSAINAPLAGWYAVHLNFQYGTGSSYAAAGYIFQGSTLRAHVETQAGANTASDLIEVSAIIYCAANDSITARVAASTSSKSIRVTSQNGYFSMLYLGAQS